MKARVFVGSSSEGLQVASALQANLERDAEVVVWAEEFLIGQTWIESLVDALDQFDFAIMIFSPDDLSSVRERTERLRGEFLLELGMFLGRLGRPRCFVVQPHDTRSEAALAGMAVGSYDADRADRDLVAALGPVSDSLRQVILSLGPLHRTDGPIGPRDRRRRSRTSVNERTVDVAKAGVEVVTPSTDVPAQADVSRTIDREKPIEADTSPKIPLPVHVFLSYSHRDEKLKNDLDNHLSSLKRQGLIRSWNDRMLVPGADWKVEIEEQLASATIIVLLVSASFLASDFCYDDEMKKALGRHRAGEARVIPVIVSPVDWKSSPLGNLQALPKDAKPVTTWSNRQSALLDVASGIRQLVEQIGASVQR